MPISRILSLCEDCEPFDVAMCSGCIRRTSIKVTKPRAADQQQAVAVDLDQESEAFSAAGPIVPEQYVEQTPMGGPQQDQFAGFVEGDGDVDLDDVLADAVAYTRQCVSQQRQPPFTPPPSPLRCNAMLSGHRCLALSLMHG